MTQTRTYYIAADEIIWNFAPLGRDVINNKPLPPLAPFNESTSIEKDGGGTVDR